MSFDIVFHSPGWWWCEPCQLWWEADWPPLWFDQPPTPEEEAEYGHMAIRTCSECGGKLEPRGKPSNRGPF